MLKEDNFYNLVQKQISRGTVELFEQTIKEHLNNSIKINKIDYEVGFVEVINTRPSGIEERITLDLTTLL